MRRSVITVTLLLLFTVLRGNGGFVEVASLKTEAELSWCSLNFDAEENILLGYLAERNSGLNVQKYDGAHWSHLGDPDFSGGRQVSPDMLETAFVVDQTGTPYVVFADNLTGITSDIKVTVMKYKENRWEAVGKRGFSPAMGFPYSMTIDSRGNLFVVFDDATAAAESDDGYIGQSLPLSVMKFDGETWDFVGKPMFVAQSHGGASIVTDKDDVPIIAFNQIMRLSGTSWEYLEESMGYLIVTAGEYLFTEGYSSSDSEFGIFRYHGEQWDEIFSFDGILLSLRGTPGGTVFMAYQEKVSQETVIMRYREEVWTRMGVVPQTHWTFSMQIDEDSVPFVVCSSEDNKTLTVFKYTADSGDTADTADTANSGNTTDTANTADSSDDGSACSALTI